MFGSTSIVNNISDIVYPLFAAYWKSVFVPLGQISYLASHLNVFYIYWVCGLPSRLTERSIRWTSSDLRCIDFKVRICCLAPSALNYPCPPLSCYPTHFLFFLTLFLFYLVNLSHGFMQQPKYVFRETVELHCWGFSINMWWLGLTQHFCQAGFMRTGLTA